MPQTLSSGCRKQRGVGYVIKYLEFENQLHLSRKKLTREIEYHLNWSQSMRFKDLKEVKYYSVCLLCAFICCRISGLKPNASNLLKLWTFDSIWQINKRYRLKTIHKIINWQVLYHSGSTVLAMVSLSLLFHFKLLDFYFLKIKELILIVLSKSRKNIVLLIEFN